MPDEEEPPPPTPLEIVSAVPVVDGEIDAVTAGELVPGAVTDPGGNGWPVLIDQTRLLPTLWLAVQDLAARVEALEVPDAEP